MRNATKVTVSIFGALAGLMGIEHGIGETLQGNIAPDGLMILSWPGSELFHILTGEPAMTIVPNLLVTGILAIDALVISMANTATLPLIVLAVLACLLPAYFVVVRARTRRARAGGTAPVQDSEDLTPVGAERP